MAGSLDMEEQYDRIYCYCYFRLHSQQAAEDITQETFLRYLENERFRWQGTVWSPGLRFR